MNKTYTINPRTRLAAIVMAFAVGVMAVLAGFLIIEHGRAENYRRYVVNHYKHAFNELAQDLSKLDSTLQKTRSSGTSGYITETCMEINATAQEATASLSELPNSDRNMTKTSDFICQVGDYAFSLAKKTARGDTLTAAEAENLSKLSDVTSVLSNNLQGVLAKINDGSMSVSELDHLAKKAVQSEENQGAIFDTLKVSEEEFPEIPTLIYDGPFSSHISGIKPKLTEGAEEISKEDAEKKASEFSVIDHLELDGERSGNLPVYMFSGKSGGAEVTVEVSKAGGYIVNSYSSYDPKEAKIDAEAAVEKAKAFLAEHGYENLKESYYMTNDDVITINFAHMQNDVIVYPDLIKVAVARDNGTIVSFEGQGYVMNHREREIPAPGISAEDAKAKVSKSLTVLSEGLAIIPTGGKNEVFCHEFKCENKDGAHVIVYINAENGQEQQILLLQEDENGTLAV
ncbi:MAG: germination protein YpeB [Oscillospiraceae bacterium]|jgi:germination protein YpeB|nr:germination protein YpeB [Oscillospiraceae bacterium]